ncbi:MAG: hypothetical protein HY899_00140 [Deltaproteobacteria bacterium]|nr:hypothetical protein [Deltaproteobacteria bacterium]
MTRAKSTALVAVFGFAGISGMFAAGVVLAPRPAVAATATVDVSVDAECIRGCMTDLRACMSDARQAFVDCSIQDGCVELAAQARVACASDRTASVCVEARADYADCIRPCRAELRADVKACQNEALTCLHDTCALTDLPEQCSRVRVSASAAQ